MKKGEISKKKEESKKPIVKTKKEIVCKDKNCVFHGHLKTRGRIFEGEIIRKFLKRITIEFERMVYVQKYERYAKSRTRIHARLPECKSNEVDIGDIVQIQECRPLSKTIHFTFIKKIKNKKQKI